jgi:hypothetical protein
MRLWHVPQTILVAGYSHDPSTHSGVTIAGYAEYGALDMTFGAGTSHTSGRATVTDFALTRCDGAGSVMEVDIDIKPSSPGRVWVAIFSSFPA